MSADEKRELDMTIAPKSLSNWLFSHRLLVAAVITIGVNVLSTVASWVAFSALLFSVVPVATQQPMPIVDDLSLVVLAIPIGLTVLEGLLCLLLSMSNKRRRVAGGIAIGAGTYLAGADILVVSL